MARRAARRPVLSSPSPSSVVPVPTSVWSVPDGPAVLTVAEVAAILRVGRNHVYALAEPGQILGVMRLGRPLRFSAAALRSWLRQSTPSGGHGPNGG